MHFQCYTRHFRSFKSVAENIFVSLWIMKYLASIPKPKNNKKKLNFNFGVMVVIRSYLNFGKLHFEKVPKKHLKMQTSFLTKRKIIGDKYIIGKMEENVNINKINQ